MKITFCLLMNVLIFFNYFSSKWPENDLSEYKLNILIFIITLHSKQAKWKYKLYRYWHFWPDRYGSRLIPNSFGLIFITFRGFRMAFENIFWDQLGEVSEKSELFSDYFRFHLCILLGSFEKPFKIKKIPYTHQDNLTVLILEFMLSAF